MYVWAINGSEKENKMNGFCMEKCDESMKRELLEVISDVIRKEMKKIVGALQVPVQGWLSIKHAAEYADLSNKHIRKAVTGAMLPASNVGTLDRPYYRISKVDLDVWLEKRKSGAIPPQKRKGATSALPPSQFYPKKQPQNDS